MKSKSSESVKSPRFRVTRSRPAKPATAEKFPIVGIGASAGGFEAFIELLKNLPEKTGMAYVFVQHLDPTHGSMLPEILSRATRIPVEQVTDGVRVRPNQIYVIPANTTMLMEDGALRLVTRARGRGQHMPIDQFFSSLAEEHGNQAIGVILSGTASDGTEGCCAIKAGGGITFAQDEASAKYAGMPRSAASAGYVDFVLPPRSIARELTRIGRHPYVAQTIQAKGGTGIVPGSDLNHLLALVREATGVDFGLYKQTTLHRRIKRRMVVHHLDKVKDYLRYVRRKPEELHELYREILIHVTGFFRGREAFEALREQVLPNLFASRKLDEDPIRIWVPGCSTGEEAYSIAIAVVESWTKKARIAPDPTGFRSKAVQIFATDISEPALERARSGLYSAAAVADVSAERLERFFTRSDGGYQVNQALREMCIFARQNLAKDPPFSNLDLITCRNLLIYLGPELQKRIIPTFHYALKPDGYLMLGESESLGTFSDHFVLLDKKNKIYRKKRTATRLITFFSGVDYSFRKPAMKAGRTAPAPDLSVEKEVDRVLGNRYIPASIVVNEQMEIVQFRGQTGAYLEPASGHPTFSLSKMAREGLLIDLRTALNKVKRSNSVVTVENVRVQSNGGSKEVNLEVIPVRGQGSAERFYVVVFQKPPQPEGKGKVKEKAPRSAAASQEKERLNREVRQLRDELRTLIEDHETTTEEFKSANEEVLSANEELQSTNEELETAKEELQSSNEELSTLNEELQNRNTELSLANGDMMNLLANVNIPIVMVDNNLRIRRFTTPAEKLLNLIPADVGRRLREVRPNLDFDDLETLARRAIENTTLQEQEVREREAGTWHLMRIRPYKSWDNKIEGAVLSFQDIDALKQSLEQARTYADALIGNAREPLLVLDRDLRVTVANPAFYRTFFTLQEQTEGKLIYDLGSGQWNIPRLRDLLHNIIRVNARVDDFEVTHDFPGLGTRTMILNARRIEPQSGTQMIFLSCQDVTEQRSRQDDLKRHGALLELANDAVFVRDLDGKIRLWNYGAERLYGWTKEEALGQNSSELLHTEFPVSLQATLDEVLRTGQWQGELVHHRKDGERRLVSSRWAVQLDTGPPAILEINTDITERKFYEESLRQLSTHLMRVQDEERRRIARDLHDSTGQKLVALKMYLSQMGQGSKTGSPKEFEESLRLLDDAVQEIRTLSQLLHPPLLEEAGLASATRWLAESFGERARIKVDLKLAPDLERLPENIEIALFRVIQESLNNVHRHSGADRVSIELTNGAKAVMLRISDNGKGLPPQVMSGGLGQRAVFGVGILGMRERLSQLGGTLSINSTKKGTVVEAKVPAKAEK
jgi:two-component system, chemotaxis family, CheB/CheR fusion protein